MLTTYCMLAIFIASPVVFIALYFFTAPYGRHTTAGWGPSLSERMGWLVMESPAVLLPAALIIMSPSPVRPIALALLGLWELHYVYRTLVFPFLIRDNGRGMPLVLAGMAFVFNLLNGYGNGSFLAWGADPLSHGPVPAVRIGVGAALFVAGLLTHMLSDRGLRRLRAPGEVDYKLPRGGLFDLVASPNYFGEIVEWTGWALATWSLPGLAFALFTVANLVPRAHSHWKWYLAKFPDYPQQRKRVIPFVY
jgi:3-oxo-5-alpha-steroid 4-dehydrogenase 1